MAKRSTGRPRTVASSAPPARPTPFPWAPERVPANGHLLERYDLIAPNGATVASFHAGLAAGLNEARANAEAVADLDRVIAALRTAREYVVDELAQEERCFAGYLHASRIEAIKADLADIDGVLERYPAPGSQA